MLTITPIPAFNDNYIWLISLEQTHYVVDPGDAKVVIKHLKQLNIQLNGILITHHHYDHTGGIAELQQQYQNKLPVYGPDNEAIDGITHPISVGDDKISLPLSQHEVKIFHLPGHTLGHIAYLIDGHLFCGDTLFSGGCGRLFEGTPQQMLDSLTQLSQLDGATQIYPAHEYTQANLRFALVVEPENPQLQAYSYKVQQLRTKQQATLPSTIAQENAINPFLRADSPAIWQKLTTHFQQPIADKQTSFTLLRQWKDNF
ncbi:hydroxyacylglutathione hydrolase [Shewanella sp. Isolate11]|uniref:hydroxyacylglutathione hydrolase n=1 Tax=Shewanella sp. Isolate11 TaxID=2908530 RepID=UPI001EFD01A5|nr:hydroxyacylglutathione hydrolase [Shewanella sp. Isolate11]MCG9696545.1 hydroxyacylglutathione hydrolase [Shewanella sp. Isolate11]